MRRKSIVFICILLIGLLAGCTDGVVKETTKDKEVDSLTVEDLEYLEELQAVIAEFQVASVEYLSLYKYNRGRMETPEIDKKMYRAGATLSDLHFKIKNIEPTEPFEEAHGFFKEAFKSLARSITSENSFSPHLSESEKNKKTFEHSGDFSKNFGKGEQEMKKVLEHYQYSWTADGAVKNE